MATSFYVASKCDLDLVWRYYRDKGVNIISTWIDEGKEIEPGRVRDVAVACITEASKADVTVLFSRPYDRHKGALVEVGAALASGKIVRCVGLCDSIRNSAFRSHPNWFEYDSIEVAFGVKV